MNAPTQQHSAEIELNRTLEVQQAAFKNEGPVALATRIDRIDRCIAMLVDNQQAICDAVNKDFGNRSRYATLMMDVMNSVGSLKFVKKNLKKWMKPEKRTPFMPMNFLGAKAFIKYQPKGVVGVMTPWNVPVTMIFSPLAWTLYFAFLPEQPSVTSGGFTPAMGMGFGLKMVGVMTRPPMGAASRPPPYEQVTEWLSQYWS